MSSAHHDVLRVHTPDNVGIGYVIAGLGSRLIAQMIDGLIVGVLLVVTVVAVLGAVNPHDVTTATLAALAAAGIAFAVEVAYFALCEMASGGRTPGKAATGLRVLDASGSAPSAGQLLLRNVARLVDSVFGIGVVVMFWDRRSRRLGDLLAGTVVVHVRAPASLASVVAPPPVLVRTPDAGPPIDGVERLGEHELSALRTFLSRPGLDAPLRARLAAEISDRLVDRLQLDAAAPERQWPPELLLERLYLQLQARSR